MPKDLPTIISGEIRNCDRAIADKSTSRWTRRKANISKRALCGVMKKWHRQLVNGGKKDDGPRPA